MHPSQWWYNPVDNDTTIRTCGTVSFNFKCTIQPFVRQHRVLQYTIKCVDNLWKVTRWVLDNCFAISIYCPVLPFNRPARNEPVDFGAITHCRVRNSNVTSTKTLNGTCGNVNRSSSSDTDRTRRCLFVSLWNVYSSNWTDREIFWQM